MEFGIIAVFVIIIAVVVIIGLQRGKKLAAEGKIIKRQDSFWESAEYFTTNATINSFVSKVKSTDFSDCKITIEYHNSNRLILFKSNYAWNAAIEYQGVREGKNIFKFSFPAYRTRRGIPYRVDTMNIMETAIEKVFLSLDPQTLVETHRMKYKTKF